MSNPSDRNQSRSNANRMELDESAVSGVCIPDGKSDCIRPSPKRYLILLMYGICSMEKSFQWINLSTITNKVSLYYGVDNIAVNWTSVLFMLTFIPLVLPTGWLIERIGLRKAILIGSTGITLGAVIKCFSCSEDRFYVVILGQIVVSLSEQFIFCVPARIASVWFPDHQVSLATGFGIFGNQCGIALGFLIPQALLDGLESREEIGIGLYRLFLWTAIVALITLVVLLFFFDNAPKHAPGIARSKKIIKEQLEREEEQKFSQCMKELGRLLYGLISDRDCALLVVAYGINVGTGYAIQTLLNQMVAGSNWSDPNQIVGNSGLMVIFCGMIGALYWGHLCDLTHKYVLINKILYVGAIVSMILFGVTLQIYNQYLLYVTSAFLGFNLIGYTVVGLDTIVEMTYPAPELVSTSMINLSPQIFGTAITFISSAIVDRYESEAATGFLVAVLTLGLLITAAIRENLKRQTAVVEAEKSQPEAPPTIECTSSATKNKAEKLSRLDGDFVNAT